MMDSPTLFDPATGKAISKLISRALALPNEGGWIVKFTFHDETKEVELTAERTETRTSRISRSEFVTQTQALLRAT